jgi:hypothetical protein
VLGLSEGPPKILLWSRQTPRKRIVQVQKRTKEPEDKDWTVFHAEGPTWLLLFVLFASIATVVLLAIVLSQQ